MTWKNFKPRNYQEKHNYNRFLSNRKLQVNSKTIVKVINNHKTIINIHDIKLIFIDHMYKNENIEKIPRVSTLQYES